MATSAQPTLALVAEPRQSLSATRSPSDDVAVPVQASTTTPGDAPPAFTENVPSGGRRSSRFNESLPVARPEPAADTGSASLTSLPPPYGTPEFPAPAYGERQEPATVSRYLFKYGFFFPPFWIIGVFVLFMRLEPTPEAECGKSAEEQAEEIILLRRAEVRWSKRCAYALLVCLLITAIIVLSLFGARVGAFKHSH
ncbi:hypothetical protein FRB99_002562 [Tulasnella sp. 403]|nr:hypothetical protein FRB99_002562 [Tulasnella sp. 403]